MTGRVEDKVAFITGAARGQGSRVVRRHQPPRPVHQYRRRHRRRGSPHRGRQPPKDWIEATDLEPYRQIGGRAIVEVALGTIAGYTPSEEVRDDYIASYDGDRFAESIPYVQSYPDQLPILGALLSGIQTPVRIVQDSEDEVVPAVNATYPGDRH
jgi:hypothetical protein